MTAMKATVFALAAALALVAVPDGASARGPSFEELPPTSTPWTVTRTRSADITYGANPTTTFYYNVQGSGSPALSHITFGVSEVAMANFVSGTVTGQIANPTIEVGRDPTTNLEGVKFDDGQPETATWEYAMTFDGHYAEGPIRIATKGSRFYSVQELDGPVALSEVTTPPGTPPSGPSEVCTYGENVPVDEDNIVYFGGREIATLDFSAPNGREVGCQAERLQLPDGWYLAPNEPFYRAAFGGGSGWSTDCLVMADGEGFSPKTLADCGSGLLDVAPATANCNASYGVTSCDMRVAITRNNTIVDTFIEHGDFESPSSFTGALSDSAWSDIQLPGRTVKYPVYQGTTGRNPPSNAACLDTTVLADDTENIFSGVQQSSGNLAADSPLQEGFSVRGWANIEVPLSAQTTPPTTFDPDGRDFSILVDLYYTDATADYGVNAPFNSSLDNEWQSVSLDIFPRKRLSHFIVSLVFYNAHGRVCFDDISTGRITGQLVEDGGFEGPPFDGLGGIITPAWMPELDHEEPQQLPQGPMLPPHSGQGQVCFNATTRNQKHGIAQINRLNDVNARVLYLSGWSQAINVTGNEDGLYSIYMDIQYDNGDWLYGQYASFETGTHDWEFSTTEVYPRRPVRYIYVYALFRSHKGWACFDDVTVAYGPSRGATPKLTCSSYGDPHIRTWDALDYDLQSEGEYTLTDDGELEVQARFEAPSNVDPHATVTTAASMFYGNDTVFMNVAVYARVEENATAASGNTDPPYLIVQDPALNETGHAIIMPTTGTFALTLTDTTGREVCNWRRRTKSNNAKWTDRFDFFLTGQLVVVETYRSKFGRQYQRITVSEKSANAGPTVGLCGNRNNEKGDEFILRGGGAALTQPLTPVQMYDEFGESWRLDNTTTNFFYLPGTSPETYHNRSWDDFYTDSPDQGLRRQPGTYTPAERAEADEVCDRGLDATLFAACVWDVLFSGDIGFAEDYPLLDQAVVVNRTTSVFPNHTEPENPTSLPVNSATPPSSPPASDETYSAASTTTTTVALAALAAAIALAAQ